MGNECSLIEFASSMYLLSKTSISRNSICLVFGLHKSKKPEPLIAQSKRSISVIYSWVPNVRIKSNVIVRHLVTELNFVTQVL